MLRRTFLAGASLPLVRHGIPSPFSQQSGNVGWVTLGKTPPIIIWGGASPELPGVDGKGETITISDWAGVITKFPIASNHYFQFPFSTRKTGYITWSSTAPYTDYSIAINPSPPVGGYWPPNYTPLPPNTGPSQSDKDFYDEIATYSLIAGSAAAALAVISVAAPVVVITASLISAVFLAHSGYFQYLVADPPDPDYNQLAQAQTPTINAPAGVPACNQALLTQAAVTLGIAKAVSTTVNRISGAARAKSQFWVNKQNAWYLELKPELMASQSASKSKLIHWAENCGPKHPTIAPSTILSIQKSWWRNGFPVWMQNAFAGAKINLYSFQESLIGADPTKIASMINTNFSSL